jgi:hypothetical protein
MPTSPGGIPDQDDSDQTERFIVTLIPQAAQDLRRLQERTGLSRTDIMNRAISLYRFIEAQLRERRDLTIRDQSTGEAHLVRLT